VECHPSKDGFVAGKRVEAGRVTKTRLLVREGGLFTGVPVDG
jgi:hypothetical protein